MLDIKEISAFRKEDNSFSTEKSEKIYNSLTDESYGKDEKYLILLNKFIEACLHYAKYRSSWILWDYSKKAEIDSERTIAHNAMLGSMKSLYDYMEENAMYSYWFQMIGTDRKNAGDFACYVAYIQGVNAR